MGFYTHTLRRSLRLRVFFAGALFSALVSIGLFFAISSIHAQESNSTPILEAKSVSAESKGDRIFILNDDETLTIYSVLSNSFEVIRRPVTLTDQQINSVNELTQIIASNEGKFFAAISKRREKLFIDIFDTEVYIENQSTPSVQAYEITRNTESDSAFWGFFDADNKFYIKGKNSSDPNVYVFNLQDEVLDTLEIQGSIIDVKVSESDESLFMLTRKPNMLHEVTFEDGGDIASYEVDTIPDQLLEKADENVVVLSNRGADSISIVDLGSGNIQEIAVGTLPRMMAYDKDTGAVFVGNNGDGSISILDKNLNVQTVPVSTAAYAQSSPLHLFYSEDEKRLYVINATARKVHVYDPNNGQVVVEEDIEGDVQSISTGDSAAFAVVHRGNQNNLLFLSAYDTDVTSIPDTISANNKTTRFSGPHSIMIDRDDGTLFVGNRSSGDISVLDGDTYDLLARINTGSNPQVIFLNQLSKKMYVADPVDDTITIVDTSDSRYSQRKIDLPDGSGPRSINVNESTNTVYVSLSGSGQVAVIDGIGDSLVTIIDLGSESIFPLLSAVDSSRDELYVVDYGSDSVYVLDGKTNSISQEIEVGQKPIWVRYIEAHDRVYVSVEGENKVLVIDPQTKNILKTFELNVPPYRILRDDKNLVYVVHRGESIVTVLTKEGEQEVELLAEKHIPYIGELDFVFNMIKMNATKQLLYLTHRKANRLFVVNMQRDADGILNPQRVATVEKTGEPLFPVTPGVDVGEESQTGGLADLRNRYIALGGGIGILLLIVITLLAYRTFRQKREEPSELPPSV